VIVTPSGAVAGASAAVTLPAGIGPGQPRVILPAGAANTVTLVSNGALQNAAGLHAKPEESE